MWLDDFDIWSVEGIDSAWNTASSSSEVSEKFKESIKKSTAGTKRIQKDEKKAKKYDFMLSNFLIKIILDKRFDWLLELIFICLDKWYPSNFLLWIMSLVYEDISKKIREVSQKNYLKFDFRYEEPIEFSNEIISSEIKSRINFWVEDMIDVVIIDSSELSTKKLLELMEEEKKVLDNLFVWVFVFFFKNINVSITQEQAFNYIDFISWELKKSYKNFYFSNVLENSKEEEWI